ncbi:MAG TPA: class I SAM-dependent methyltransferase [Chitinophagaceae bacterium]|nr:class I SAM-dependent methyltransferase [Chitinophagaceae bacterium]
MTSGLTLECPVCGHKDVSNLESIDVATQHLHYAPQSQKRQQELTEAAMPSALSYQMVLCNNCQLEFANPKVAPGPAWYDLAYQTLHLYPHDRWEFQFVVQNLKSNGHLLELGCGSGEFLKICKTNNIPAMGLDFSPEAVNQCHKAGLDVQVLDLTKESNNVNKDIKTITAFHVLEHLDDPVRIFDFASKVASKDTVLWIAVPSHARPSRTFGMIDFLDQPPHHMTRWNRKSLKEIGRRANWSLDKIYYEPISTKASCWWITTKKMKIYKLLDSILIKKPKLEFVLRTVLFPFAFISRRLFFKQMQGFTMLAVYRYSS